MSRWAGAFAGLSRGSDTVGTLRHSAEQRPTASRNVKTVTPPSEPVEPRATERGPVTWHQTESRRATIVELWRRAPA
jgi:hypothetical protein